MIVEQAIRYNATGVISDCDHPGKVYAAKYLSEKNVSVICVPDKYTYLALGHNLRLVGSPPIEFQNESAIIGNRPIKITRQDRILAVNASAGKYALWYYQTPASYFETISKTIPLNVSYYNLTDFGQMDKAVQNAVKIKATILATRIFNSQDYWAVSSWLLGDQNRKAVLFHSASYPYGQKLFREFKNQTTFDDPNPIK